MSIQDLINSQGWKGTAATVPSTAQTSTGPVTLTQQQVNGLQPILSDLLTAGAAPKNSYQSQTYTIDPTKMQERLGQYNVYNSADLGGLGDYFAGKAAANQNGKLYFKQADFDNLANNLATLNKDQATQMAPMLGNLGTLASSGDLNFYDKAALQKALSGYGQFDISGVPVDTSKFNPVATVNGSNFYAQSDLNELKKQLAGYGTLSAAQRESLKNDPRLAALAKAGTLNGTDLYKTSDINPLLTDYAYNSLLSQDPYKLNMDYSTATDNLSKLQQNAKTLLSGGNPNLLGGGITPNSSLSAIDQMIQAQSGSAGIPHYNEIIPANPVASKLRSRFDDVYMNVDNKKLMQNVGAGLGLTNEEVDKVARLVAANQYENSMATGSAPFSLGVTSSKPWSDALVSYAESKYGNSLPADVKDKINTSVQGIDTYYSKLRKIQPQNESLLGMVFDVVDPILDTIDPMHNTVQEGVVDLAGADSQKAAFSQIMPAVIDAFFPGVGSLISAANAASTENWGGALGSLAMYGLSSYGGTSGEGAPVETATSTTGQAANNVGTGATSSGIANGWLGTTGNTALDKAITAAGSAGLSSAAGGQGWDDILKSAALAGAGSYGGSSLGSATKDMGALGKVASQLGYNSAMGGLSSYLRGGSFGQGAQMGALGSLGNFAANALTRSLTPSSLAGTQLGNLAGGISNAAIKNYLAQQLYKSKG